jgi:hypothetical protein
MALRDQSFAKSSGTKISFDANFRSIEEDQLSFRHHGKKSSCLCLGFGRGFGGGEFPRLFYSCSSSIANNFENPADNFN